MLLLEILSDSRLTLSCWTQPWVAPRPDNIIILFYFSKSNPLPLQRFSSVEVLDWWLLFGWISDLFFKTELDCYNNIKIADFYVKYWVEYGCHNLIIWTFVYFFDQLGSSFIVAADIVGKVGGAGEAKGGAPPPTLMKASNLQGQVQVLTPAQLQSLLQQVCFHSVMQISAETSFRYTQITGGCGDRRCPAEWNNDIHSQCAGTVTDENGCEFLEWSLCSRTSRPDYTGLFH